MSDAARTARPEVSDPVVRVAAGGDIALVWTNQVGGLTFEVNGRDGRPL